MARGRAKHQIKSNSSAYQQIKNQLKWVDIIFEVLDARAPSSSRHPQALKLYAEKPRVVILAKADLADPQSTKNYLQLLSQSPQQKALALDLKSPGGKKGIITLALELCDTKLKLLSSRGRLPRPLRACVVGMPNVGKSSLINWLIGKRKAATANKPGITKGPQWVRLNPQIELLDTPGILPATQLPETAALKLALLNLIPESSYDLEEVAFKGISLIRSIKIQLLEKYTIDHNTSPKADYLSMIALACNCLTTGGLPDRRHAAQVFLRDLRSGCLGQATLDTTLSNDYEP